MFNNIVQYNIIHTTSCHCGTRCRDSTEIVSVISLCSLLLHLAAALLFKLLRLLYWWCRQSAFNCWRSLRKQNFFFFEGYTSIFGCGSCLKLYHEWAVLLVIQPSMLDTSRSGSPCLWYQDTRKNTVPIPRWDVVARWKQLMMLFGLPLLWILNKQLAFYGSPRPGSFSWASIFYTFLLGHETASYRIVNGIIAS